MSVGICINLLRTIAILGGKSKKATLFYGVNSLYTLAQNTLQIEACHIKRITPGILHAYQVDLIFYASNQSKQFHPEQKISRRLIKVMF